jgi:prepilin-type processing-associated H-X9-DG protein
MNNLKQFGVCWQMYANDNESKLVQNLPATNQPPALPMSNTFPATSNMWSLGNMRSTLQATNADLLKQGMLYAYTSATALYHCPADSGQVNGTPRVRSYSMNGWVGSSYMNSRPGEAGYQTFVKEGAMAAKGTSQLWVFMDEHEASIDDSWFEVTMNDSAPFASFPANRHGRGYNLNFADGHVEHYKLQDPNSQFPPAQGTMSPANGDWVRLKLVTTVPWGQ